MQAPKPDRKRSLVMILTFLASQGVLTLNGEKVSAGQILNLIDSIQNAQGENEKPLDIDEQISKFGLRRAPSSVGKEIIECKVLLNQSTSLGTPLTPSEISRLTLAVSRNTPPQKILTSSSQIDFARNSVPENYRVAISKMYGQSLLEANVGLLASATRIKFNSISGNELNGYTFKVTLTFSDGQSQTIRVKRMKPLPSSTFVQTITNFLLTATTHKDLIAQPQHLVIEMNMLAYNLKKLTLVARAEHRRLIADTVASLEQSPKGIFEFQSNYIGRLLNAYLNAKTVAIDIGQSVLASQAAMGHAAPVPQKFQNFTPLGQNKSYYVPTYIPSVQIKRNQPQPLDRRQELNDSTTIASMGWALDPGYMLTHPWFWGVSDRSPMSGLLLMQIVMDSSHHQSASRVFESTPLDPKQFLKPVDPVFVENNGQISVTDTTDSGTSGIVPYVEISRDTKDLPAYDRSGLPVGQLDVETKSVPRSPDLIQKEDDSIPFAAPDLANTRTEPTGFFGSLFTGTTTGETDTRQQSSDTTTTTTTGTTTTSPDTTTTTTTGTTTTTTGTTTTYDTTTTTGTTTTGSDTTTTTTTTGE